MGWFSGIVVYLLTWWTVFLMALPWGHKMHQGSVEEGIRGAPEHPYLKQKFIATTLVSLVIWVIIYILVEVDIISFREMAGKMS